MVWRPTTQAAKFLLALPLVLALSAARLSVTIPPQMAKTDAGSVELGKPFVAKPGSVLLTAKVFDLERITLSKAYHASVDRFSQDLPVGTRLSSVWVPADAEKITGSKSKIYYCGQDLAARSEFADLMIGDLFSKWESIVRFCFVDEDNDGALDHMIIAGAKNKALQKAQSVAPIPYQREVLTADENDSQVRIVFSKLDSVTGIAKLEPQLWRNGKRYQFDYLLSERITTAISGGPGQLYPQFKTNPAKLPYPMRFTDVMGADIGIRSINKATQEAEFVINRAVPPSLFKPVIVKVNYVYIYI